MSYLFLDSTNGLTIGILNSKFEWIHYEDSEEKRPSEIIHVKINQLFDEFNLDLKQTTLVIAAGPGSYTGMRLGEGIAHILTLCHIKVLSFYHFEVPQMIGAISGKFVTNAFKGQYFVYEWSGEKVSELLINANDMSFLSEVYSNLNDQNFKTLISTKKLIKENSKKIFKNVVDRDQYKASFYFRSLDDEFKSIC